MPVSLEHRKRGRAHLETLEATITDETWPCHPSGRRKTIGELTTREQTAVARGAVAKMVRTREARR
jgi:hypothetical protein